MQYDRKQRLSYQMYQVDGFLLFLLSEWMERHLSAVVISFSQASRDQETSY
jgi:hypothetical protein